MSWVFNICGCINPIKDSIINYLNSSHLTDQVIEEEKCSDQLRDDDENGSLYKNSKDKSYNFMKLDQNDPDEKQNNLITSTGIIDVYWYPEEKASLWDVCRFLYKKKLQILQNNLNSPPEGFDRIYDSQDQIKLSIYSRVQTLPHQKKINVFRFSFVLNAKIQEYVDWTRDQILPFQPLLQQSHVVKVDDISQIALSQRKYKKILVINQHEFLVASKTQIFKDQQQQEKENEQNKVNVYTTIFSVKDKPVTYPYSQGWANLCGMKVRNESQQYLTIDGYINVELDVNVSPTMLKQALAKEIRIFIQKMINSIKKK